MWPHSTRRPAARHPCRLLGSSGRQAFALGEVEILLPGRVDPVDRNHDPNALLRRRGSPPQAQANVGGGSVLLAGVAGPACSNDVVPGVKPASAARHDVIDVLRGATAVLAFEVVAHEDSAARQRRPRPVGNLDEVVEPHHAGRGHRDLLAAEHHPIAVQHLGFAVQSKDERPPDGNDAQRLIGRIEDKCSAQSGQSI
jgi:hypothetical protein